jgi:glycosyltransferase involved in cell wall biosynthesis/GT2 family glycosyltransferase
MTSISDFKHHVELINASDLFDRDWYLEQYPDVRMLGIDPVEHYVRFGARLRRNPHPLFETGWYATHHADIARAGVEPLVHFLKHGRFEGRKTLPVGGRHPTYSLCVDRRGGIDLKRDHWDSERESAFLNALRRVHHRRDREKHEVSVILPTYNRSSQIIRAIRSVQEQTHDAWELLVVDDGSSDDTEAVVAPLLADPRIRYLRQSQGGVAKARNTGLQATSAPFVCYLDSDNSWRADFLATMTTFMSATGLDAAYCGAYCFDDGARGAHYRGDDFCWSQCLHQNYIDMNCFAHRRELVERFGGFDERLLRLVDWDLILRMTRDTRTAYAPFCGVRYYDGTGGGRITNTHYLDGALKVVAAKIRAKHAPREPEPRRQSTAEELLEAAGAARIRSAGSAAGAPTTGYDRRVGYVVWDWPALSQTFVVHEVRTLIERGCDVVVYYHTEADKQAPLDFAVPTFPVADAKALSELASRHGRSVLHSPFAYPATTLLTWPCSVATGIPFTFMPAGVDISHYKNIKRNRVDEVASSEGCLGVITLGTYHRDFLIEQGVPPDKIVLQPQFVSLPPFRPRYRMRPRPRVISIARFIEKKGLGYLVEAAAALPGVDFHLYGYGPLEDALRGQARQLGLHNLHFEAPLSTTTELHDTYAAADLFVLPCVRAANGDLDGMPTVILEAMASGVPVISNRISNIPDVLADGQTGMLATPGDTASLVAVLRRALELGDEQRRILIDAARKRVEGHADSARSIAALEGIWATGATPAGTDRG